MIELRKALLHWMMIERADGTSPLVCFDDGGGGDGGGGDGDGGGDDGEGGGEGDPSESDPEGGPPGETSGPTESFGVESADPEAAYDFSTLDPGVTLELSAQSVQAAPEPTVPEVPQAPEPAPAQAAPTTEVTSQDLPDITSPEINLPEINVSAPSPSEKEATDKEEGPPNEAPSSFGTFGSAVDLITDALMGRAEAATPVSGTTLEAGKEYDAFGNLVEPGSKTDDRIEPSQPGPVPPEALGRSEEFEKEAASKEQNPFEMQNAAFNTFGVEPGFFGAQNVEPAAPPTDLAAVPGMPQEVAAPQAVQQEQQSTPKDDPLNTSMTPNVVTSVPVSMTPAEIAAMMGTPEKSDKAEKAEKDDPFGVPSDFTLAAAPAPQSTFDLNTPNPSAPPVEVAQAPSPYFDPNPAMATPPYEVAQAPQAAAPSPYDPTVFDPTPMNPAPSPAPPVEIAQAPASKSDREDPSTREFDPNIFESFPTAFAPPAQQAPVPSFAPQPGQPQAQPVEVARNAPSQSQAPAAISGIPAGVPADVPSGVPSGALTNDDIVSLPGQQLTLQQIQQQKAIKAKRDAIAMAMMGQDPNAQIGGIV